MTRYICYRVGCGYLDKAQRRDTHHYTYTQNPERARTYKTKQTAAAALGMRSCNSQYAREVLRFFEVEVPEPIFSIDTINALS